MTQDSTYNVRFRGIRKYKGRRGNTYTVRWTVNGKDWQKTYPTAKLADGHAIDPRIAYPHPSAQGKSTEIPAKNTRRPDSWRSRAFDVAGAGFEPA